jgi:hypothetical protein
MTLHLSAVRGHVIHSLVHDGRFRPEEEAIEASLQSEIGSRTKTAAD